MTPSGRLFVASLLFALLTTWSSSVTAAVAPDATSVAKPASDFGSAQAAEIIVHRRVHYQGDIWMTVSNNGKLGTDTGGDTPDPEDMSTLRINYGPSFEFPAGKRVDYLYNGSLWVGGVVGPDTLVSMAITSGSVETPEWNSFEPIRPGVLSGYPGECDTITRHLQQGFTAVFSDTLIRAEAVTDPSGRGHLPLGLEVVQTTHQSPDNFTKRFIIYDYKITNVSDHIINDMWVGIFTDNDVYWNSVSGCLENPTADDITGFLPVWPNPVNPIYSDSLRVTWAIDDDGDACGDTRFPLTSARGAMGARVLRGPKPESRICFNWFGFNTGNIDWGPRLATDDYGFGTGGTGLPPSDAAVYHVMSNGEIDYSQPFAAIDYFPVWQRPAAGAAAANIANGFDTRMCLSAGPVPILNPGESVPFTVAFIVGANVHRVATNKIDPLNPQLYVDNLDFSDLATNAWWAGYVWDNYGVDTNPLDGNDYKGEYYFPIFGDDTVYYSGDGCPDLTGPAPPPGPDSANSDLRLISRPGELILTWTGRTVETSVDPTLRAADFEGYRVYIAARNSSQDVPGADDYALIASWDRIDFRRHTYDAASGTWMMDSNPLTNDEWRDLFDDPNFDAALYPSPSLANCYRYKTFDETQGLVERCAYFRPQDVNQANEVNVAGQVEQNLIQRIAVRDTVIDERPYQYGVYEMRLDSLLQSQHYFLSLTAFDYGDPNRNLEPLETAKGGIGNRLIAIPIYSADVVEEYTKEGGAKADSVRVAVYPNPYKVGFIDAMGNESSYFEQGFEGKQGQAELNEQDRRIHFINLPDTCVINIYTLDGDLVRTLVHPDPNLSGYSSKISWDLVSRNTQAVTSGIYLYRVDSRLGAQVGKLVIIK